MSETSPQPIYSPIEVEEQKHLELTPEQKDAVRGITLGIEEVDESIREMAVEDVIRTLENGHPLDRIIADNEGEIAGYIACEDFVPHEAYIKYMGTNGEVGRNLLREVPAFFEYAKQQGYTKLNFHGWNNRLNHVLEHFGFQRIRTDNMGEFSVDFYEKSLVEEKSPEEITQERINAFEQKYLTKLSQEYSKTLQTFKEDRSQKEQEIAGTYQVLSSRLSTTEGYEFSPRAQAVLKLKLARYFQNNETLNTNTLYDALIETPKFLDSDKGQLTRLFEVHQEKTIQKIAETRRRRAEMTGNEGLNPYEALFQTQSGKYYMARLLNMPHLEEESQYMSHCVGTSDSYINQIKRGDIEILSFRTLPQLNTETHQLEGEDRPIITIEYNLRTNTIEQMKKANDNYLQPNDPYFNDAIEALKMLRQTETDMGKPRDFRKIAKSELGNIKVADWCVLTENGQVNFQDFDPESSEFILKIGEMPITAETSEKDIAKIVRIVEDIKVGEDEIAQNPEDVTENTKLYIGPFSVEVLQMYPKLEYYYTSFPEGRISRSEVEVGGDTKEQLQTKLNEVCRRADGQTNISEYAQDMLNKMYESEEFQKFAKNPEQIRTVRLKVRDLGFTSNPTIDQIYAKAQELGLELCPAEVGPYQRLKEIDQPMGDWYRIAMKQISGRDGRPRVFGLERNDYGLWLHYEWTNPTLKWDLGLELMFRLRNVSQES